MTKLKISVDSRIVPFYTTEQQDKLIKEIISLSMNERLYIRKGLYLYKGWCVEKRTVHDGYTDDINRWCIYSDDYKQYFEQTYLSLKQAINAIDDYINK